MFLRHTVLQFSSHWTTIFHDILYELDHDFITYRFFLPFVTTRTMGTQVARCHAWRRCEPDDDDDDDDEFWHTWPSARSLRISLLELQLQQETLDQGLDII